MHMTNEFVAKKLGEVLAFAVVGQETYERGSAALSEKLGAEKVADIASRLKNQEDSIRALAKELEVYDITNSKEEKTGAKLRQMRDLYVGDQWHNAVELMEWSGFFEGAGLVHYALIAGIATELQNETMNQIANEGNTLHQELLDQAHEELYSVGQDRAK